MYNWDAMSEFEANASMLGWQSDDYIDVTEPTLEEDDPWGTSDDEQRLVGEGSEAGGRKVDTLQPQSGESTQQQLVSDSSLSTKVIDDVVDAEATQDQMPLGPTLGRDEPTDEDVWLFDAENGELEFEPGYFSEVELEEPEPIAEYDSDLGEPLYESAGTSEDLAKTLRIDEFIADIGDADWQQMSYCAEMLGALSAARLRHWLKWLRRQIWTGDSLLLFLDFRLNCWEENDEWWELNVWREWTGHWWTYSNPGTLSLDATYELITLRMAYPAEQIVEKSWFDDWNEHSPWRLGVPSFAEFVLFRAGLKSGEDWLEILRSSSRIDLEPRPDEDPHFENASHLYAEYWFAIQDWHDSADWHDNLGWASGWIEATHPYLPDPSWQQHESA